MKTLLIIATLVADAAVAANRTIIYSTATVTTHDVHLTLLADGGCAVDACASVQQLDGGPGYDKCAQRTEVSGTPQTRCLNTLNSADALWKANEGL